MPTTVSVEDLRIDGGNACSITNHALTRAGMDTVKQGLAMMDYALEDIGEEEEIWSSLDQ